MLHLFNERRDIIAIFELLMASWSSLSYLFVCLFRTYARVVRNRVFDENLSFGPADSAKNPVSLARCVTPDILDSSLFPREDLSLAFVV